jgi:hypothetical protein
MLVSPLLTIIRLEMSWLAFTDFKHLHPTKKLLWDQECEAIVTRAQSIDSSHFVSDLGNLHRVAIVSEAVKQIDRSRLL